MLDEEARAYMKARLPFAAEQYRRTMDSLLRRRERARARRMWEEHFPSSEVLLSRHFEAWVNDYQCTYGGFARLFSELGERPARIVETGTSAWGVDSTRLWDGYVRLFGGRFWSVDLRPEPSQRLIDDMSPRTSLIVNDSVSFIRRLAQQEEPGSVDVFYLDSYDLDWDNPAAAEAHCLEEWEALLPLAHRGSLVLIDDTPADPWRIPRTRSSARHAAERLVASRGFPPGKGAQVLQRVLSDGSAEVIWQHYNVLLRIN